MNKKRLIVTGSLLALLIACIGFYYYQEYSKRIPRELIGSWKISEELTRNYEKNALVDPKVFDQLFKTYIDTSITIGYKSDGGVGVNGDTITGVYYCSLVQRKGNEFELKSGYSGNLQYVSSNGNYIIVNSGQIAYEDHSTSTVFYVVFKKID